MPEDNVEPTPPVFLRFRDAVVRVDRGFAGSWYLVKEEWLQEEGGEKDGQDRAAPSNPHLVRGEWSG